MPPVDFFESWWSRGRKPVGFVGISVPGDAEERFIAQKASDGKAYFDCVARRPARAGRRKKSGHFAQNDDIKEEARPTGGGAWDATTNEALAVATGQSYLPWIEISSTSKMRVALGPIWPPAPRAPYARSGGMNSCHLSLSA